MKKDSENLIIDEKTAITYLNRIKTFFSNNKISILGSLFVIIALIAGSLVYTNIKSSKDENASNLLTEMMDLIKNDANTGASLKEIGKIYSQLKIDYPSNSSSKISDIVYASYMYNSEKYSDASKIYEESLKNFEKDPLLGRIALAGSGYSYLMLKENKKAISSFDKICTSNIYMVRDEAFINNGIAYKNLEDSEKYKDSFLKAIEVNNNSIYAQIVKEKFPG